MKKTLLVLLVAAALSSCKKGLIFDKEMVIGDWKMWELYTPGSTYYWTFTADSVFIYQQSDEAKEPEKKLVYQQGNWNSGTFDINLFELSNPFDSTRRLTCFIDIAKYHRDYVVIKADQYNWSATLSRVK